MRSFLGFLSCSIDLCVLSFSFLILLILLLAAVGQKPESGLSLVVARDSHSSCSAWAFLCSGFSVVVHGLWGPSASVVGVCRLSSTVACGIFPDQGLNPCPLRWQAEC